MAVTSPPRPSRASTSGRPASANPPPVPATGQFRVHWDRVVILATILVLIMILVVVLIIRAVAGDGHRRQATEAASAAGLAAHPSAATTSAVPSVAPQLCPSAAARPIYAAPAVAGGDPAARTVALTFDDGPGKFTYQVLDILNEKQVRATFFVLGKGIAQHPEMLKAIVTAGDMVGNHTWSHPMPKSSIGWKASSLAREIQRTQQEIAETTGQEACLFRPPGGVTKGVNRVSHGTTLSIVMWSVDTRDWSGQRPGNARFANTIRKRAQRGLTEEHPLVLLHDGGGYRGWTVAALPGIIDDYRAAGYQFVDLAGRT